MGGRIAVRIKDGIESFVARCSVHEDRPVYDKSLFPWAAGVEREWQTILRELEAILPRRSEMLSFHELAPEVSTITRDDDWKTFVLMVLGSPSEKARRLCPETLRILGTIPGLQTAFFSILSPGKHIPAHRGAFNGLLRYHLGLIVPEPSERCRIRIADETHHWKAGASLIFDDTFNHEVWNDTDGVRVVLFVDFLRPLKFPLDLFNRSLLGAARLLPMLRAARDRQRRWERSFPGPGDEVDSGS
jgi:beta-hydroxylase